MKYSIRTQGVLADARLYKLDADQVQQFMELDDNFQEFAYEFIDEEFDNDETKSFSGQTTECTCLIEDQAGKELLEWDLSDYSEFEEPDDNPWEREGKLEDGNYLVMAMFEKGSSEYELLETDEFDRNKLNAVVYSIDDETGMDAQLIDGFVYDGVFLGLTGSDTRTISTQYYIVRYQDNHIAEYILE